MDTALLQLAIRMLCMYRGLLGQFPIKWDHVIAYRNNIDHAIKAAVISVSKDRIWRWMPFTYKQWTAWTSRKVCKASLLSLCRRQHTLQLTNAEQKAISDACSEAGYKHWSLGSIYYQLMRDDKLHCSSSTFYKYCRLLHITRKRVRKTKKYNTIKASAPFEILHMDLTLFKTLNSVKHYIYVIRDNFSRAILACDATLKYDSAKATETLREVMVKYNLTGKQGTLITDDGSENKGEVINFLKEHCAFWKHEIAQLTIPESNSVIEAGIKIMKYNYLFRSWPVDTTDLMKQLAFLREDYGNIPQRFLYGHTPNEVLAGAIPDKHLYKAKIAAAAKNRIKRNQQISCTDTC